MQPSRRLLARVLVPFVFVLATCSTTSTVHLTGAPTSTDRPAPVVADPGRVPHDLDGQLRHAVLLANLTRWYARPSPVHLAPDPVPVAVLAGGDRFDRLASCESGDGHGSIDPAAVSPGGRYRGAFQFTLTSWQGAGMDGDPVDFGYGEQKAAAVRWAGMTNPAGQWPVCWWRSA